MKNLIINEELKNLLPPLSAEEFAGLEESILKDGCLSPLIAWNETLIDGHNRYEICTKHKIPFSTQNIVLDNLDDAKLWALQHQQHRRNQHRFLIDEPDFRLDLRIVGPTRFSFTSEFGVNNMVQLNFDANQVAPLAEYTVLPEGQYLVEITNSCQKQTKAGDGNYLELEYTVLDGEHKGAHHWDRLCLDHPSEKAMKRAHAALSAICHSIGVMAFHDTVELHQIPFQITVRNRTDDNGRVSAEVAGYAPRPTFTASAPQNTQASNQPPANRNPGSNPWARPSQS